MEYKTFADLAYNLEVSYKWLTNNSKTEVYGVYFELVDLGDGSQHSCTIDLSRTIAKLRVSDSFAREKERTAREMISEFRLALEDYAYTHNARSLFLCDILINDIDQAVYKLSDYLDTPSFEELDKYLPIFIVG